MQLADAAHSQPPAKPSLPTDAELRAQAAEGRAKQQSQQAAGSDAQQAQQAAGSNGQQPQMAERALSLKPQHAQQAQQATDRTATQPVAQVMSPSAEKRAVIMWPLTPDVCTTDTAFMRKRQGHRITRHRTECSHYKRL